MIDAYFALLALYSTVPAGEKFQGEKKRQESLSKAVFDIRGRGREMDRERRWLGRSTRFPSTNTEEREYRIIPCGFLPLRCEQARIICMMSIVQAWACWVAINDQMTRVCHLFHFWECVWSPGVESQLIR